MWIEWQFEMTGARGRRALSKEDHSETAAGSAAGGGCRKAKAEPKRSGSLGLPFAPLSGIFLKLLSDSFDPK